ncbi:hypothetical protein QR98_0020890 [Sarcoptes scabiei]|uniref:Glycoprotein hormone subunit beta domain-containing protein n=1 Tax=Sarcoptes scabiei TaxID=52283 RepID=A0A131ZZC8_SARSC|nr:hypothetical protein QR98_0020890 [Sarcoptes scabiei]
MNINLVSIVFHCIYGLMVMINSNRIDASLNDVLRNQGETETIGIGYVQNGDGNIDQNQRNESIDDGKRTTKYSTIRLPEWRINEKIRRKFLTIQQTLDCHERSFTFKAIQTDPKTGLQCRDYIKLLSCWGRCNSGEISDYRFPYKRSFHYVCIHNFIERKAFKLTDCDPGAPEHLQWYRTVVAKSCVCRQCESSMANCESASIDLNYIE